MNEKRGLPRPPLFTEDYITLAEITEFSFEKFGRLILAIMYYVRDGTEPEGLPPDMKAVFTIYQKKVDAAQEKYDRKCAANAENGAKGGRPRKKSATTGEGSRAQGKHESGPKCKIPPMTEDDLIALEGQIIALIERGQEEGSISDECDPDEFFDWMQNLKWKINGTPARGVGDFLAYAAANYPVEAVMDTIGSIPTTPKLSHAYGIIFSKKPGLRDGDGNTLALSAAVDFLSAYDGGWNIHGKMFTDKEWSAALAEFMQDL